MDFQVLNLMGHTRTENTNFLSKLSTKVILDVGKGDLMGRMSPVNLFDILFDTFAMGQPL